MKAFNYFRTLLFLAATVTFAMAAVAQDNKPTEVQPQDVKRPAANQPQDQRANMLRQLGLSQEQIQQIRKVNAERKPLLDEAQKRFREANHTLDEAIYADQFNEADFQARLKEVQLAQVEVAKIRFMNELAVRRILTPEQLVRFRELRQRFEKTRENFENHPRFNGDRPFNRQRPRKDINTAQDGQPPAERPVRPSQQQPNP